jgi:protein phosphatase
MPVALRVGGCTLKGNWRSENEDAIGVAHFPDVVITVVADGMGGSGGGAQASQCAVVTILSCLSKPGRDQAGSAAGESALRHAVARAHEEVVALQPPQVGRLSSTITLALWFRGADWIHLAHLGDCRAYRVRGGVIEQLTTDHNIGEALVAAGRVTRAELHRSPGSWHVLYRFLGAGQFDGPDIRAVSIQADDRLLLCSDGLSSFVPALDLLAQLRDRADAQECAERLCQLALDRGSRDNISAVVIRVA